MAFYDSGSLYDSGERYDAVPANRTKRMAKVKLNLDGLTDAELASLGTLHTTKMTGNATFPSPVPNAAGLAAVLTAFTTKQGEVAAAELALAQLYSEKEAARDALELALSQRGNYVEMTSGGDAALIQSAGFDVQAAPTPTTSLARPENVSASTGDDSGEIDVSWNRVAKARNYVVECREHIDGQVPGPWTQVKIVTRSKLTASGLVTGRKYAFRVRALGPNSVESPWSDEAVGLSA